MVDYDSSSRSHSDQRQSRYQRVFDQKTNVYSAYTAGADQCCGDSNPVRYNEYNTGNRHTLSCRIGALMQCSVDRFQPLCSLVTSNCAQSILHRRTTYNNNNRLLCQKQHKYAHDKHRNKLKNITKTLTKPKAYCT